VAVPELVYHADAIRALSVEPRTDPAAVGRIAAAEAACGRRLPAAVREWYTLAGAEELLTLDDDACGAAHLDDILGDLTRGRANAEFYGPRRVNTGYQAYVSLIGPDDPPVEADGDPEPLPFSRFVARMARYVAGGEYE
jgi:hypothetical protein